MKKSLLTLVIIALTMFSCKTEKEIENTPLEVELIGSWEYLGFGRSIIIGDSTVQKFHLTSKGNVQLSDSKRKNYFEYYSLVPVSNDTIQIKDGVKTFTLVRTNIDYSKNIKEDLAKDPVYNFEILWNTFNEQYCYFTERNIDWNSIYKKYEPKVNSNTKPLELYLIFERMLGEINDGHISIDLPDELEVDYENQKANTENEASEEVSYELVKKVKNQISENYLNDANLYNRGDLKWGMINEDVAYLQTSNMIGWAHYPIADSLSNEQFWDEWWKHLNKADNHHDDVANGTRFIMDSIVNSIGSAKACIIDLRFNGGGFDDVSIEILNHFVNKETEICTKKVRLGKGFTEKQTMSLIPSEKVFEGKLFILTSHQTASAAELLVLGSKEIPNAKIIGSTTEGVFSDILKKKLPNGWTYGLSNMIYQTMDGVSYEEIGITPDYILEYPVKSKDFYEYLFEGLKDGDDAIELVIAEMKSK